MEVSISNQINLRNFIEEINRFLWSALNMLLVTWNFKKYWSDWEINKPFNCLFLIYNFPFIFVDYG